MCCDLVLLALEGEDGEEYEEEVDLESDLQAVEQALHIQPSGGRGYNSRLSVDDDDEESATSQEEEGGRGDRDG